MPDMPVRFVWGKTTKRCKHNAEMKEHVIADLKAKRDTLYGDVPADDFEDDKKLDHLFEQSFKTLKEKFKAQTNDDVAAQQKQRESDKARRARRHQRKKAVGV